MRFALLLWIFSLIFLTGAAPAAAAPDIAGVKIEDSINIYNNTLLLNGAGFVLTGKTPHYVAKIYARQKFSTLDEFFALAGPKRLTLTAVREVETAPIMKMFNRSVETTANRNDMAKLVPGLMSIGKIFNATKSLKPGEVLTMDWVPMSGLVMYLGGRLLGEPMREPEFFRAAASVWMGEPPTDPKLRDALLGKG